MGFRYFAQEAAQRLHLSGYVRNLRDSRVEVYAIGTPDQLAQFRAVLENGTRAASVEQVQEELASIDPLYAEEFIITYHDGRGVS